MNKSIGAMLAILCASLTCSPARAQVDSMGSPSFFYRIGVLHTGETDFHPLPQETYKDPLSSIAEPYAFQIGGDVRAVARIGSDLFGFPAYARVGATNAGRTFWANAQSPKSNGSPVRGSHAEIIVKRSFRKLGSDAFLSYTYNNEILRIENHGGAQRDLGARVTMAVRVYSPRQSDLLEQPL